MRVSGVNPARILNEYLLPTVSVMSRHPPWPGPNVKANPIEITKAIVDPGKRQMLLVENVLHVDDRRDDILDTNQGNAGDGRQNFAIPCAVLYPLSLCRALPSDHRRRSLRSSPFLRDSSGMQTRGHHLALAQKQVATAQRPIVRHQHRLRRAHRPAPAGVARPVVFAEKMLAGKDGRPVLARHRHRALPEPGIQQDQLRAQVPPCPRTASG